jgi:hypothetical protein
MKKRHRIYSLSVFILAVWTVLYSQELSRYSEKILRVEGRVHEIILEDCNSDGLKDIIALHSLSKFPDPAIDRFLSVFIQDSGRFSDIPSQTLRMDQDEIVFDIADIDADSYPELLFLRRDGIYFRKFSSGGYAQTLHPLLFTPSVFLSPDPSKLTRYPFIRDIDGDTHPEILIPQPDRLLVYSKNAFGEYCLCKSLWNAPKTDMDGQGQFMLSLHLPILHVHDFNSDAVPDLLLTHDDRLDVYLQHSKERHDQETVLTPPNLIYRFGSRDVNPSPFEPIAPSSIFMEPLDLNADGFVDILLSKASRASFTKNISQIQIYINKTGRFDILPDQVITTENFGGEHTIQDFNGDGLLDLGLLTFKIGFAQALRFLITKKAGNSIDFYLMRSDDTFTLKPDSKISFTRRVKIDDLLGTTPSPNAKGDFNGDGLNDIFIETDTHELSIFLRHPDQFYRKRQILKISATVSKQLEVDDVNSDGFSDILFWYPDTQSLYGHIILIQSLGVKR